MFLLAYAPTNKVETSIQTDSIRPTTITGGCYRCNATIRGLLRHGHSPLNVGANLVSIQFFNKLLFDVFVANPFLSMSTGTKITLFSDCVYVTV